MNYSSECINQNELQFKNLLKNQFFNDAENLSILNLALKKSQKFIFPSHDKLNITVNAEAINLMKLPYPITAFEFSNPNSKDSSQRIALALDCSKNTFFINYFKEKLKTNFNADGIIIVSFLFSDKDKKWTPMPIIGYFNKEMAENTKDFILDNTKGFINFKTIPFFEEVYNQQFPNGLSIKHQQFMIAEEVGMAIRATLMLNSKNLKTFKIIEPNEKLNKKRIKNNQSPYFDYYTLDLFFSDSGLLQNRKKVDYNKIKQELNSTTLLKRLHAVRGHFKIRSSGIFWWNTFTRGNKIAGVIEKDYEIKSIKKLKI